MIQLRNILVVLILLFSFQKKSSAQLDPFILEAMIQYFMSYDEINLQCKISPSLKNTYMHMGMRGGHTTRDGYFTGGLAMYYSYDPYHGIIGAGQFQDFYFGLFLEPRSNPRNKIHFSFPMTFGMGQSSTSTSSIPTEFSSKSDYLIADFETVLNYQISDVVKLHFGPGFAYTKGSNTYGFSDRDLTRFTLNFGVRLGNFKNGSF
jgi:hypothetical protein